MTEIESTDVVRALEEQGLNVRAISPRLWAVPFDVEGVKKEVLLFISANDYFGMVSPIDSPQLTSKPSGVTHQTLVTLLEVSSSVPLAKVDFQLLETDKGDGEQFLYSALSYCSVLAWSGEKLRIRMRDVAVLAVKTEAALSRALAAPAAAR